MIPPTLITAAIAFEPLGSAVERAGGPGTAPTAFRIWKSGTNVTDMGPHEFTEESARALIAAQAERGLRYSIDVDHLSLNETAPPESRKAVGWHELALRQGPDGAELWAVNVEWTEAVRGGLEQDPPEWRYFSPAYRLAKDSNVIAGYVNLALTNNPATHHVTALAALRRIAASAGDRSMAEEKKPEGEIEDMTIEDALAAFMGDDEGMKEKAKKCMASKWAKAAMAAEAELHGEDGGKEKEAKKKASEAEAEKEKEKEARASSLDKLVGIMTGLAQEVQTIKASLTERANAEAKLADGHKREAILAKRPDLTEALRATLSYVPTDKLETELAKFPRARATVSASVRAMSATGSGGERGDDPATAIRPLSAEEQDLFDKTNPFKRKSETVKASLQGGEFVMPARVLSSAEAAARAAEIEKEMGLT